MSIPFLRKASGADHCRVGGEAVVLCVAFGDFLTKILNQNVENLQKTIDNKPNECYT